MLRGPVMPSFSLNLVDVALLLLQMGSALIVFCPIVANWKYISIIDYRIKIKTHVHI